MELSGTKAKITCLREEGERRGTDMLERKRERETERQRERERICTGSLVLRVLICFLKSGI